MNIYIQWNHSLYCTSAGGRLFWACSVMFILSTSLVCLLHLTVNYTLNIFIMIMNLSCQWAMKAANIGDYHASGSNASRIDRQLPAGYVGNYHASGPNASGLRRQLPCQETQCQWVM